MAQKEYFPSIGKIKFEGKESKNPLAYRYYDAEKVIMGKKMKDWLKFAMAWWHTLCAEGGDQFGGGTKTFPWNQGADALTVAKQKADAGFEIMEKLGIEYFCFHDVDLISEGNSIEEYEANMKAIVAYIKEKMQATGIKNLWGTANVFGHERYMNGAATNPDFNVVARAAVQIKNAIDATIELGGSNYVFWGGREGYMSLLNTDMKRYLSEKPYGVSYRDFLDVTKKEIGTINRVVMNPPFTRHQDIDHVRHAYDLLDAGGVLVAIMCESTFFRSDKKSVEFRDFLGSVYAQTIKLEPGAFRESGTDVVTRIVKIRKPM